MTGIIRGPISRKAVGAAGQKDTHGTDQAYQTTPERPQDLSAACEHVYIIRKALSVLPLSESSRKASL